MSAYALCNHYVWSVIIEQLITERSLNVLALTETWHGDSDDSRPWRRCRGNIPEARAMFPSRHTSEYDVRNPVCSTVDTRRASYTAHCLPTRLCTTDIDVLQRIVVST